MPYQPYAAELCYALYCVASYGDVKRTPLAFEKLSVEAQLSIQSGIDYLNGDDSPPDPPLSRESLTCIQVSVSDPLAMSVNPWTVAYRVDSDAEGAVIFTIVEHDGMLLDAESMRIGDYESQRVAAPHS